MKLNPYLLFDGQCEAAFKFYERVLGGKIEAMMPHEGTPVAAQVPPEWRKKILHARLIVGDDVLMGSDAPPDRYEAMKGFSVTIGSTIRRRRSESFTHWRKTGPCACRYRRLSGPSVSACWPIDSALPG